MKEYLPSRWGEDQRSVTMHGARLKRLSVQVSITNRIDQYLWSSIAIDRAAKHHHQCFRLSPASNRHIDRFLDPHLGAVVPRGSFQSIHVHWNDWTVFNADRGLFAASGQCTRYNFTSTLSMSNLKKIQKLRKQCKKPECGN